MKRMENFLFAHSTQEEKLIQTNFSEDIKLP